MVQVGVFSGDIGSFSNQGVMAIMNVVDLSPYVKVFAPDGILASFVSETLDNNIWMQVGYVCWSGAPMLGFVQIWDVNKNKELWTSNFPITLGYHSFGFVHAGGGLWDFVYDGEIVFSYVAGSTQSAAYNPFNLPSLSLYSSTENNVGDAFPPVDIDFSYTLATFISGQWRQATEGFVSGDALSWGVSSSSPNITKFGPDQPGPFGFIIWDGSNPNLPTLPTVFLKQSRTINLSITLTNPNDTAPRVWAVFLDNYPGKYLGGGRWENGNPIASTTALSGTMWNTPLVVASGAHILYIVLSSPPDVGTYAASVTFDGAIPLLSSGLDENHAQSIGFASSVSGSYAGPTLAPFTGPFRRRNRVDIRPIVTGVAVGIIAGLLAWLSIGGRKKKK